MICSTGCSSVVPFLSSGLVKNGEIMSMFVLFSRLFSYFESLAFSENGGKKPYTKAINRMFSVNFQWCNNLS